MTQQIEPNQIARSVLAALRRILRPLVRFLLTQGLTYPNLAEFLKSIYVDVAQRDFPIEGKRQTDSRISLLTGVHRKDVRRLSYASREGVQMPPNVSLGAQLVARWLSEPRYLDNEGRPLALSRLASEGGERSFEALVMSVSKDIRSRAVLDEWLRLGVARLDDADCVSLVVDAFVPEKGFEEKVFFLGHNVGDHMEAATRNVAGESAPFIERSVYYDELSVESIQELRQLSAQLGMHVLQQVNKRALELEARDAAQGRTADQRINFGIYFYHGARDDMLSAPTDAASAEGEESA